MRGFLSFALISGLLAWPATPNAAERSAEPSTAPLILAQGGSTGGTIGKQNKSVSGGEETAPPAVAPKPNEGKASPCGRVAGVWAWFTNSDVIVRPNGTLATGSLTGTWTCKNDRVVMVWSHGFTDRLTLSPDGAHLTGSNGFVNVSGRRK